MTQADQEMKPFQLRFRDAVASYVNAPFAERLAMLVRAGAITADERSKALEKAKRKRRHRVTKSRPKKARAKSTQNGSN